MFAGHDAAEHAGHVRGLVAGQALDLLGHHRGGGLADGAALAGKLDVLHSAVAGELHVDVDLVAAGRVVAVHVHAAFAVQFAKVARLAAVIEYHALVQFSEFIVHAAKNLRASWRMSIMRSTSSLVL